MRDADDIQVDLPILWSGFYPYTEYGDTSGTLEHHDRGGDQMLPEGFSAYLSANQLVPPQVYLSVFGDADVIRQHAIGGDDTMAASQVGTILMVGDARLMLDHAVGGDDVFRPYSNYVVAYGDAEIMSDHAFGGNDSLFGSAGIGARLAATNHLYGDAYAMSDQAKGGDDMVFGGGSYPGNINLLYGDAYIMSGHAKGGDDTLVAGRNASRNEMWGDAAAIEGSHVETGRDVFVPGKGTGMTIIHDFEPGKDVIDVRSYGFSNFFELSERISVTETGSYIFFSWQFSEPGSPDSLENSITVLGDFALTPSDFLVV